MFTPQFMDSGEDGAGFYCLAFAPVKYCPTKAPEFPAALGIYFCAHLDFTRFSWISFAEDGRHLAYTRGNDRHDTLEFLLLSAFLESSIHPAVWRLFPRAQIPADFRSDQYDSARCELCRLLFHFRGLELAAR